MKIPPPHTQKKWKIQGTLLDKTALLWKYPPEGIKDKINKLKHLKLSQLLLNCNTFVHALFSQKSIENRWYRIRLWCHAQWRAKIAWMFRVPHVEFRFLGIPTLFICIKYYFLYVHILCVVSTFLRGEFFGGFNFVRINFPLF